MDEAVASEHTEVAALIRKYMNENLVMEVVKTRKNVQFVLISIDSKALALSSTNSGLMLLGSLRYVSS